MLIQVCLNLIMQRISGSEQIQEKINGINGATTRIDMLGIEFFCDLLIAKGRRFIYLLDPKPENCETLTHQTKEKKKKEVRSYLQMQ